LRSLSHLLILVVAVTSVPFLTSCQADEQPVEEKKVSKKKKVKKMAAGMEDMLAPPDYSVGEGIQRYLPAKRQNDPSPLTSRDYTAAAESALHNKDDFTAIKLATEAIKLDPNNSEAYYARGRARFGAVTGEDQNTIDDLQMTLKLNPAASGAWHCLARVYASQNNLPKAIEAVSKSIEIKPGDQACYKTRATLYVSSSQKENAIADYTTAFEMNPKDVENLFSRGQVYETLKQPDKALVDYKACIDSDTKGHKVPYKLMCFKRIAEIYNVKGDYKKVVAVMTDSIAMDQNDEELYRMRGLAYAKLGENDKAVADYSKAIDMAPEYSARSYESRSKLYEKMGKKELAAKDRVEASRLQAAPAERPLYDLKGD